MSENAIKINLSISGESIECHVHPLDSLRVINQFIPESDRNFICVFDNKVLSMTFTFAFYGITDGSTLYLLNIESKMNQIHDKIRTSIKKKVEPLIQKMDFEEYRKIFCKVHGPHVDEETVTQSYNSLFNPTLAREAAKIKDRFFERVEGTIKCHRKLIKHFLQMGSQMLKCKKAETSLGSNSATPNTGALPQLYVTNEKDSDPSKCSDP